MNYHHDGLLFDLLDSSLTKEKTFCSFYASGDWIRRLLAVSVDTVRLLLFKCLWQLRLLWNGKPLTLQSQWRFWGG